MRATPSHGSPTRSEPRGWPEGKADDDVVGSRADKGLRRLADRLTHSSTTRSHSDFFLPYLQAGTRLIECGCGNGQLATGLAEFVAPGEVVATDEDAANVESAAAAAQRYGIDNMTAIVAANGRLPFPDGHFDAAFAHGVLSSMRNPSEGIRELCRVVRSGGYVGIRDIDLGGTIISPEVGVVSRSFSIIERLMAQSGGNPRMGRHLAECLHNQGLADVKLSASYQCEEPSGERHEAYEVMAKVLSESPNVDLAVDMGWTTRDELEIMAAAWRTMAAGNMGYFATAFCEVVGRVD